MSGKITESAVEEAALGWLGELGYSVLFGPDIAHDGSAPERRSYSDVVLVDRLRCALVRLNPKLPSSTIDEAIRKVVHPETPSLVGGNRAFHRMLADGVTVEVPEKEGGVRGERVMLADFIDSEENDRLAVNQFSVTDGQNTRRLDIVVFLNGLPIAAFELKNPASEDATVVTAINQLQTYKAQIPSVFLCNEVLVASDGLQARVGSLTAPREWFLPWRTIDGTSHAPETMPELEVLVRGLFDRERLLDYLRHFIVFEDDGKTTTKKIAGYHQFHATRAAIRSVIRASATDGDGRAGVVWHTQGSGKSLTMVFFAGKLVLHPALANPTIVVITDRNDLDEQLFGTFARCREILRQAPVQAADREDLRGLLQVAAGGIVFTTVQKFLPEEKGARFPLLSDRRNILVIADEAHRSQYDFIDGFARHVRDALPHATFVGFTGTPIERDDRSTIAVFGDCISIYDIQQAVADGATVPIYYESRIARLELDESAKPHIDPEFEEVTEGEEVEQKERLKSKWAQLEAVVGTETRIARVAEDLVRHFDGRLEAMEGKAMVVCMSRRICVALYEAIMRLRPDWQGAADDTGVVKVVMTGSASDPVGWQQHIRNKQRREDLAARFKDPDTSFRVAIVRDMWLTGFDAPCLHTMYLDKPMHGHGLMQAIARVNRVFRDKPGGLVVDYLGLADSLQRALGAYTQSGGRGKATIDQNEAVAVMQEKYEICRAFFHGFDISRWLDASPAGRLAVLPAALDHVVKQPDGRERFIKAVVELSKAFALSVPREEAIAIRDEVAFFQTVKAGLAKTGPKGPTEADLEPAIRQIVSKAIVSGDVMDIFAVAGLRKPDISILSDEFLGEVRAMPERNLAVEVLRKLLNDEIKTRSAKNLVQSRSFAGMLEEAVRKYRNRAIQTVEVIEELIRLAKEVREAQARGAELGLSEDEIAFYDALETNDSAVKVLGDETLKGIARELAEKIRANATIDWTMRETVRAKLRVMVRRILRKYGYPPDKQEKATQTVLEQAEVLCDGWATAV